MIICKVIDNIWATRKEDSLNGSKLMVVQQTDGYDGEPIGECFVAADVVGAGIGEHVLVVSGSTARVAVGRNQAAIDAAIVGIIDSIEIERKNAR